MKIRLKVNLSEVAFVVILSKQDIGNEVFIMKEPQCPRIILNKNLNKNIFR